MAQLLPTFQALTSKKAILFDMDGTLFDTEGLHAQALCLVLADQGHHFCAAEIQKKYYGYCDTDVFRELLGADVDADALVEKKNNLLTKELRELGRAGLMQLQTPGMEELLLRLYQLKIPMALISASEKRIVEIVVEVSQLRPMLNSIVARGDSPRSKPFPDPYFQAMKELGVTAKDVIIFEDSPTGLRSAFDTGAQVIRIAHSSDDHSTLSPDLESIPAIANYTWLK